MNYYRNWKDVVCLELYTHELMYKKKNEAVQAILSSLLYTFYLKV